MDGALRSVLYAWDFVSRCSRSAGGVQGAAASDAQLRVLCAARPGSFASRLVDLRSYIRHRLFVAFISRCLVTVSGAVSSAVLGAVSGAVLGAVLGALSDVILVCRVLYQVPSRALGAISGAVLGAVSGAFSGAVLGALSDVILVCRVLYQVVSRALGVVSGTVSGMVSGGKLYRMLSRALY